jgi:hypothetical protein
VNRLAAHLADQVTVSLDGQGMAARHSVLIIVGVGFAPARREQKPGQHQPPRPQLVPGRRLVSGDSDACLPTGAGARVPTPGGSAIHGRIGAAGD